jgi:threonine/homoserine/homoserine lactone efflux protein
VLSAVASAPPDVLALGGWADLGAYVLAVAALNATPGVDLLLTLSRTLAAGARAGTAASFGIVAGCTLHVLAGAFGLAALLAASPQAFSLVKAAGAGYLLWLAVGLARRAWAPAVPPAERGPGPCADTGNGKGNGTHFRDGLLTNLLNPKVALFFLAFVPQFITPSAPHKTAAFLALGGLAIAQSLVFLLTVVVLAGRLRALTRRPRLGRWMNGVTASLFAALALRMAMLRP